MLSNSSVILFSPVDFLKVHETLFFETLHTLTRNISVTESEGVPFVLYFYDIFELSKKVLLIDNKL